MSPALLRHPLARWTIVAVAGLSALALPRAAHADTASCVITGTAFADTDRNGVQGSGEAPRSGDILYLFDSAGGYVSGATTDSAGAYAFAAVPCGTYTVEYGSQTWWGIRDSLVPTTTGSVLPQKTVTGAAAVSFGWRPIVRSTTAGSPIASYTGPQGLRVESYDDVVSPADLYAAVLRGNVGAEAASTTIRFDLGSSSTTSGAATSSNGRYTSFNAISDVTYLSWLDSGEATLVHEYGHAWTLYRGYLVQQDPTMTDYLKARGLYGDSRVGSSYMWSPQEMIAEDYRQLLGSSAAAAASQANYEIPPAASVPGLRDYLLGAFSTSATPASSPTATPTATPTAMPTATPTAAPKPSPSPSASATPTPTATPSTAKGKGCRKSC
jgi:hypothetical protein